MTPAVRALVDAGIDHDLMEYPHLQGPDLGVAAAQALGLDPRQVMKTLIAELADGELVVALVPVAARLNLKALARTAGAKSAVMAEPLRAERVSGFRTGGISPFGQKRRLRTFVAKEALDQPRLYVSGGRRGLELAVDPADLVRACDASIGDIAG